VTLNGSPKRRALVVMSSARTLPLSRPKGHPGLPTGFFLVELARVLQEFGDDHEFTFATPDGRAPQLDVNGLALPFVAGPRLGSVNAVVQLEQARRGPFDIEGYRRRHPDLVDRRDAELRVARQYLGKISVSDLLSRSDREIKHLRWSVADSFAARAPRTYLSIQQLVTKHRDAADPFSLGDFEFAHLPGGHAPMVDFHDNPWMGELLNLLHENGVLISLICHAPVALTSAKYRVPEPGVIRTQERHPFTGLRVTTVSTLGEKFVLSTGYPKVPGRRTRLTYYVDAALRKAGYRVSTPLNPAAPKIVWEESRRLLTGNGPQAMDMQSAKIREIVGHRTPVDVPSS
jgi:putative intracellular protease/amidase